MTAIEPTMMEFDPYEEYRLQPMRPSSSATQSRASEVEEPILGNQDPEQPSRHWNISILLPALVASLLAAGGASVLLGWLLLRRVSSVGNSAFYGALVAAESAASLEGQSNNSPDTGGTTMYGLAFSSIVTHLVSLTTPLVLGVVAYLLASMWVHDQIHERIGSLPTPSQYGYIVELCGSVGILSLFATAKYLLRGREKGPTVSNTLVAAFVAAMIALLLNYALSISDLWLHATATTFSFEYTTPIAAPSLVAAGSVINTTLCPGPAPFLDPKTVSGTTYSNCLHRYGTTGPDLFWGNTDLTNEGAAVLANTSSSSQIQFIGSLATLLPKKPSKRTFAMETTCKPVTDCEYSVTAPNSNTTYFLFWPSFTPPFAIPDESGMPMINQFNSTNNSLIFESGTPESPAYHIGPDGNFREPGYSLYSTLNPAGVLVSLYYEMGGVSFAVPIDEPGWYGIAPAPMIYSFYISACILDIWDVEVSYSAPMDGASPSLMLTSAKNHSDFNTTSALLGALDSAYSGTVASRLATSLEGSLNFTADIFSSILAGNLSQTILASAAPLTQRTESNRGDVIHSRTAWYSHFLIHTRSSHSESALVQPSRETSDLLWLRLTSARRRIEDRFDGQSASDSRQSREEHIRDSHLTGRLGAGFVRSAVKVSGESQAKQRNGRTFKVDMVENLQDEDKYT
ncbi:hypothetical protein C8F04DRAFT_1330392 [Mycena alexandri]|uniref:Uncharacterized protein n=1 Tax=Mycena alexandri TaxID=1745969 RepID=A0AAD6S2Z3_9AGAR|nr:hypothetical protein C8F04DRAFT_1330392 [Mycena alexandri]